MNNSHCVASASSTSSHSFDEVVLPHLDAAYRLARWQTRNPDDAEDVVQEAALRAFRYFRTFTGGNGRAWFLRIVRHTCWGWRGYGPPVPADPFDEEQHGSPLPQHDPEALLLQIDDATTIERAMRRLPDRLRRVLVLRELEGLSYREMAQTMDIPMGTVMSSLSRARKALREVLSVCSRQQEVSRKDQQEDRSGEIVFG